MTKCPACDRTGGAINAETHCPSPTCTWNKCVCGLTYDRTTGTGYSPTEHYPNEEDAA